MPNDIDRLLAIVKEIKPTYKDTAKICSSSLYNQYLNKFIDEKNKDSAIKAISLVFLLGAASAIRDLANSNKSNKSE